jgi:hypothetical protein
VPYAALRAKHDWSRANEGAGISGTMGGNMFYKITPALTGTLTINPDFSDAPLDAREVNTTRFSLFLPETRAFFLQDAGNFEFGGHPFRRTNFDRVSNNGRPFFSRNLGLVKERRSASSRAASSRANMRITTSGGVGVHRPDPDLPGQVLSVARVTKQFGQSRAGFIFTHGDPTGLDRQHGCGRRYANTAHAVRRETVRGRSLL